MKIIDIRKLSTEDLNKKSNELRSEIIDLKKSLSLGQSKNVRLVRMKRKDLARVLTVLGEHLIKESK